jgi:uncharacterized protein (DUF342 family)
MAGHAQGFDVRVAEDEMSAVLAIGPNSGADLTPGIVLAHAATRGIVPDPDLEPRIAAVLDAHEPGPKLKEVVIAEGRPPAHGRDSFVRWEDGLVPAAARADAEDAEDAEDDGEDDAEASATGGEAVDHYACSDLKTVEAGQRIGVLTRPTDGEPGQTVTGKPLPARPGRMTQFEFDDASLELQSGGVLVAKTCGRVNVDGTRAWIDPVLDIEGDVDFSTGNLDFAGALRIRGGVKDRFVVRCTGDTHIVGLIESATLLIGGDLYCASGMAAKERGQLVVDGDCDVSYLNQARGRVGGTLTCRRELIESELVIGGDLRVDRGAIVGGTSVVTGRVRVSVLGSGAGAPTRLVLGQVPFTARTIQRLRGMATRLEAEIEAEAEQLATLEAMGAAEPGALDEIEREQRQRKHRHEAMQRKELQLLRQIKAGRSVSLRVDRRVYHRAIIGVFGREYEIEDDLRGPLEIGLGDFNEPTISIRGGDPRPLLDVARRLQSSAFAA